MFKVYMTGYDRQESLVGEYSTLDEAKDAASKAGGIATRIDNREGIPIPDRYIIRRRGEYLLIDPHEYGRMRWEGHFWLASQFLTEDEAVRTVQGLRLDDAEVVTMGEEMGEV